MGISRAAQVRAEPGQRETEKEPDDQDEILETLSRCALDHIGEHLHAEVAALFDGVAGADPGEPEKDVARQLLAPGKRGRKDVAHDHLQKDQESHQSHGPDHKVLFKIIQKFFHGHRRTNLLAKKALPHVLRERGPA